MKSYEGKKRFSMLGTIGSGKTTIAGCILITAQTKSNDTLNFYARTIENKSNIRECASNLRRGIFPPKTPPARNSSYDIGLEITWTGAFGQEKHVEIPLIDFAGEDIQFMLQDYMPQDASVVDRINYQKLKALVEYLKSSSGFILALPAPRAFRGNEQYEAEPEDLSANPDVNLSRLLEQVINYKRIHKGSPIEFIAVMVTKYDLFKDYAIKHGMDLYTQNGQEKFMRTLFPDTNMQLKWLKSKGIVKFYPSHVSLMYDENNNVMKWNAPGREYDGSPMVERNDEENKPVYAEKAYMTLFKDLEPFAT